MDLQVITDKGVYKLQILERKNLCHGKNLER